MTDNNPNLKGERTADLTNDTNYQNRSAKAPTSRKEMPSNPNPKK